MNLLTLHIKNPSRKLIKFIEKLQKDKLTYKKIFKIEKQLTMKKYTLFILFALLSSSLIFAQQWDWSNHLSSPGDVYPSESVVIDIKVDQNNNVYQSGFYNNSPLTINGTTLTNAGNWDAFICKYDENGTLLWANTIGGSGRDDIVAIEIVGDYLFVTGAFKSSDLFFTATESISGSIIGTTNYDIYLAKYDLDGNFDKATLIFWGNNSDRPRDMLYDATSKELVLIGNFKEDINYDDGTITQLVNASSVGGKDLFAAKLDTTGIVNNFVSWEITNSSTALKDLNFAPDTSYYVTGDLASALYFSPVDSIKEDDGKSDALLFKLDKNLTKQWAIKGGGSGFDHANSSIADTKGNIYLASKVESTVVFDQDTSGALSTPIDGFGFEDMFLAKYSPFGTLQWIKRKGSIGSDDAFGLAFHENLIQFCGNFSDTVIFNGDTLKSPKVGDINTGFAIFDLDGNEIGAQSIVGDSSDIGRSIAFANDGSTIISGYSNSNPITIGASVYTNSDQLRDGFIAKFDYPFKANFQIQYKLIAQTG